MDGWEKLIEAANQSTVVEIQRRERIRQHREKQSDRITVLYADGLLYAKGHVNKGAFAIEASAQYGTEPFTEEDVEHAYIRNVPAPPGSDYDIMMYRSKPGKGAYPVTLIDRI